MATETCTGTCRFQEHLQQKHLDSVKDMRIINNDNFFCEFSDVPFKNNENGYAHFREQLQRPCSSARCMKSLASTFPMRRIMKTIEQPQ